MKSTQRVLVVVSILIVTIITGILGQRIHRHYVIKDKLQEAVGKNEGYTETLPRAAHPAVHH